MFNKIKTFLMEVGVQIKKIDWPQRKQAINYTLIVIGISMITAIFLGILDFLFLKILGKFIL